MIITCLPNPYLCWASSGPPFLSADVCGNHLGTVLSTPRTQPKILNPHKFPEDVNAADPQAALQVVKQLILHSYIGNDGHYAGFHVIR